MRRSLSGPRWTIVRLPGLTMLICVALPVRGSILASTPRLGSLTYVTFPPAFLSTATLFGYTERVPPPWIRVTAAGLPSDRGGPVPLWASLVTAGGRLTGPDG